MLEAWYGGRGELLGGPYVPDHPYFNTNVNPVKYAPSVSMEIFERLGYADQNNDNFREDPNGQPFRLRLAVETVSAGVETTSGRVAEAIRGYLARVGIRVDVEYLERVQFEERVFENKDYDMAHMRWEFPPSYNIAPLFESSFSYAGGENIVSYSNPVVDEAFATFGAATDPDERRLVIQGIQDLIAVDQPYTFLYTVEIFASIHVKVIYTRIDPFYFFTYFRDWELW